jgi:hypothetical protein
LAIGTPDGLVISTDASNFIYFVHSVLS